MLSFRSIISSPDHLITLSPCLSITLSCLLFTASVKSAEDLHLAPSVLPFVKQYCIDCHNDEKEKGDRSFEAFLLNPEDPDELFTLEEIVDLLYLGDMPPDEDDVLQPSSEERREAVDSIAEYLIAVEENRAPSETVLRRLTRYEYNNTMRYLLGVNPDIADATTQFPIDQEKHGFTNIGESQVLSEHQLALYLKAARTYLDQALVFGQERPKKQTWIFKPEDFTKQTRGNAQVRYTVLDESGNFFDIAHGEPADRRTNPPLDFVKKGVPADGTYKITVTAEAVGRSNPYDPEILQLDLSDPLKLGIWHATDKRFLDKSNLAGRKLGGVFDLIDNEPATFEITSWMSAGSIPFINYINGPGAAKGILNRVIDAYHPYAKIPGNADIDRMNEQGIPLPESQINPETRLYISQFYVGPRVRVYEMKLEGPLEREWPSKGHRNVIGKVIDAKKVNIARMMTSFSAKAFRRPVKRQEVQHYIDYVKNRIEAGIEHEKAIKLGLSAILTSPRFLFLDEGNSEDGTELNAYELASRLSYTLWSSMPDQELLNLAASKKLLREDIFVQQVKRLLEDSRSSGFTKQFSRAWLRLDKIGSMPPSNAQYPSYYKKRLEAAINTETRMFFDYVLQENRPITDFIEASYTFLNDALATHYGLTGKFGEQFQKVELPASARRKGLLGHASVLTASANGVETSPVVRGVWVLENILGTPPSPPPPDVPPIEPDTRGATTIREQLEKHRSNESCADCHARIDPWGFGLEHYDPIGGFREHYTMFSGDGKIARRSKGRKIDGSSELPSGQYLENEIDLVTALIERRELFAHNLTTKLLTYGTGRELTFKDKMEVNTIVERVSRNGYGMQDLLVEILTSSIFQSR